MKKALLIIGIIVTVGIVGAVYIFAFDGLDQLGWRQNASTEIVKADVGTIFDSEELAIEPVWQDREVLAALQAMGYKNTTLTDLELRVSSDDEVQKACEWVEAGGCLVTDFAANEIGEKYILYASKGINEVDFYIIVAHEYLHYIWMSEALDRDDELIDALYAFYNTNDAIKERVTAHYTDTYFDISTELFSYGCTEFDSSTLGSYLSNYCNKYIDTAKIPLYY